MKKNYSLLFLLLPLFMFSQTTDLLISKYGEGTSNNKFIEIYNGTGADVDLTNYSLSSCSNGCDTYDEWDYPDNVTFPAGTTIANGDVYVVTHGSADASIASDQTFTYLSNGDDVFALTLSGATASSYTIIDILGDMQGDPGSGWAVGDDSNGTQNQTLTRKTSVCSPNPTPLGSFGTDADSSEWEIGDSNSGWDTVGSYTTACVSSTTESIPWSNDLEGDLSEFTTYQASSGSGMWAITTSRAYSGNQSVYHNDTSGSHDSYLLTPTFDLSGATTPQLTYWDNENYSSYYENHEVLVSEDYTDDVAAATWTELADGVATEDTWVERGPLTLPTSATVTVAFRYVGNYADEWYIDDISVAEAPTAASADWSVSAANFSGSATVSITTENFTVGAAGGGDDGHWHYTLDGGSEVMVYDTNDVTLTGLSTGDHTLVAWLTDDNHQALSPAVEETITWTQTNAPGCGDTLSHDYSTGSSGGSSFASNFTSPDAADLLFTTSVDNSGDTMTVTIGGTTENNYDWVYVTDGAGTVLQAPISGTMGDVAVTSTDGTINVYLASDSSVTSGPVTFTFTCETPVTYESIPWSDDFETGDFSAGWTHTAASGAPTSIWEVSTLANNTSGGANSARHNYSSSGTYDSYLVGPTFDLSGATSPVVSYSDYVDWTSDADVHSLVYSEDYVDDVDAATWVVLNDVLGSEDTWVANGPYALPATGTVTIAFRYQGYYAAEWFVDDVTVEEEPVTNTVLADPTLAWLGYMNVFDLTAGAQGGYLWGSGWGVPDLATTLNTDADYMTITLEPNYNAYADNPGDAYWQDGSGGGAKWMEGSTYVESATDWNGGELTFTGYVHHHSLASDWTANFFIKALDPNAGYSDALNGAYITALPTDGQFSVTVSAGELAAGYIVQAGFSVNGPNANPDNQAANGKVIISGNVDAPMSIDDENILDMRIYPNPVDGSFVTILSPVNGTKYIQVFDINGRRVMDTSINNNTLDVSSINSGFYMIKVTIDGQSKISKLVVR